MYIKNLNSNDWEKIDMKRKGRNNYIGTIDSSNTTPPGLEYYFKTKSMETEIYTIETEYDPILGQQSEVSIMGPDEKKGNTIAYDIEYHNGYLPNGKRVTWKASKLPTGNYDTVTSKLHEMRSCCTSPHKGVDLGVYKVDVIAMADGTIDFVESNSGTATSGAGNWIRIAHNADGSQPNVNGGETGDLKSHFFHLATIKNNPATGSMWKKGDKVKTGDVLAISGDSGSGGYHLDFGFDIYMYVDGSTKRIPMPAKYFFGNISGWNGGKDLDFVSPPRIYHDYNYGTMLEFYAYPKGTTDSKNLYIEAYIGTSGTPNKKVIVYQDVNDPQRYYAYLVGQGYDYQTVNLYYKVGREGWDFNDHFVTRPLQKYATAPDKYYSVYIEQGAIFPTSVEEEK